MRRTQQHASRIQLSGSIPQELLGDWHSQGLRFRFNYDGNYSLLSQGTYLIENGQTLYFEGESYERRAGTTGLIGVWRKVFDESEWLDITFGPYSFYAFEWNDGITGGGYYSTTDNELTIVEQRARFTCEDHTITFITDDLTQTGDFSISGDVLTIQFPDQSVEYVKIPF